MRFIASLLHFTAEQSIYFYMSGLYKNKYRIPSARLPGWDYSAPGAYFVTICCKERVCWFGVVNEGKMILSDIGKTADYYWKKIAENSQNVILDKYVVMPNHVHGILILTDDLTKNNDDNCDYVGRDAINRVSTKPNHELKGGITAEHNPMSNPKSISYIIRAYKVRCTKEIRNKYPNVYFEWQPRFYDHIILNEYELHRIREYICNNPGKWEDDKFHPNKWQES